MTPKKRLQKHAKKCDEMIHDGHMGLKIVCYVCARAAINEVEAERDRLLAAGRVLIDTLIALGSGPYGAPAKKAVEAAHHVLKTVVEEVEADG